MNYNVTRKDAKNVLDFNMAFSNKLPDEDVLFLFNTYISHEDDEQLDDDTALKLKKLCCQMILAGGECFDDPLWKKPKSNAEEALAKELANLMSKEAE